MHSQGAKDLVTCRHSVFHRSSATPHGAQVNLIEVRHQRRPAHQVWICSQQPGHRLDNVGVKLARVSRVAGDEHQDKAQMVFAVTLADFAYSGLTEAFAPLPTGRAVVPPVAKDDAAFSSHLEDVDGMSHTAPII